MSLSHEKPAKGAIVEYKERRNVEDNSSETATTNENCKNASKAINPKKLLVCFAVGAVIALALLLAKGVFDTQDAKDTVRIVCDAFFAAGAMLLVAGALVWTFDNGITDGLTYSARTMLNLRKKDYENNERESYSAYRERKHRNKGTVKEFLISGGAYFIVSVALLVVYNNL